VRCWEKAQCRLAKQIFHCRGFRRIHSGFSSLKYYGSPSEKTQWRTKLSQCPATTMLEWWCSDIAEISVIWLRET